MLITVYFILVVIVILLLIVFNVRASKKRRTVPESETEADANVEAANRPEPDVQEAAARAEESVPVKEEEPVREAAVESVAPNRSEAPATAAWEPAPSRTEPGSVTKDVSRDTYRDNAAPTRRDPSGKDVSFRGALRDMSTGGNNRTETPSRSVRTGDHTITDNDYRKALRNMRKEDKEDRS